MRIVVFGANGPTGRLLVSEALAAGHEVSAVTRHLGQMPSPEHVQVVRADVTDAAAVDAAVTGSDAVLSAIGVSYTRRPVFFTRVMEPLFMRAPGKTVYADNRRMEALIRASSLEWTIIRACWLFNAPGRSDYKVVEGTIHGMFTARADLA
jgi:uncharacterized protein YbjT (DUF2867 family)